ncbi:MAG: FUSC family protein, partial [Clostridia bacterium]|nr:FUSC family protein [Clostridia bacterium]
ELQLNQAGSKSYIKTFKKKRDKLKHWAIFVFKILLTVAFSSGFVILFGLIFGMENCLAGLVVLLSIQAFRFSGFGMKNSHSIISIFIIYAILAGGPKLSGMLPVGWSFCVNLVCIFFIVLFGCRNVRCFNHATLVLSYLLLYGSPVSGTSYIKRLICLAVGAVLTSLVFFRNHRKKNECKDGILELFTGFKLTDERTRWQIRFCICVSCAVLISSIFGASKPVWAGIAAMSVCSPFKDTVGDRSKFRVLGNIFGCLLFIAFYLLLPNELVAYFGYFGGFCAGFCALYGWQTIFNTFSALSFASSVLGVWGAIIFRILNNAFGAIFALAIDRIVEPLLLLLSRIPVKKRKVEDG